MFHECKPGLYSWTETVAWDRRPGKSFVINGYAAVLKPQGFCVLIDPPKLEAPGLQELLAQGPPRFVLLSSVYHIRAARTFQSQYHSRVWLHELAAHTDEIAVDGTFKDGDVLWDCIEVVQLPHVYWPEETAFLVRLAEPCLIIGDALCGGRQDLGVPDGEIGIFKTDYITSAELARASLGRLLAYPFTEIFFGHGTPVLHDAKGALRRFLAREEVWRCLRK